MIWWALPVYTCLTDIQCNAPIKQGAKKPNIQAGPSGKLYVTAMNELNIILSSQSYKNSFLILFLLHVHVFEFP